MKKLSDGDGLPLVSGKICYTGHPVDQVASFARHSTGTNADLTVRKRPDGLFDVKYLSPDSAARESTWLGCLFMALDRQNDLPIATLKSPSPAAMKAYNDPFFDLKSRVRVV
ncbi:MAG: hypothetical protein EOP09_15465 [Proteobacteria bacterium]|nr:MAG: hypothetical protein EOP09_15465 [Pseudomonadota bacterium]